MPTTLLNPGARLKGWRERLRQRRDSYRPLLRDWRFWVVLGLTILMAIAHDIVEAGGFLEGRGILYLIPISLFLVPVIYAAQTFGFSGGLAAALLITVITIPNLILWHHGWDRFGALFQIAIMYAAAFFVGQRVKQERNAWQQAETTANALRASRLRYRSLFESSPIAVLVLDFNGTVQEANPAASLLFDRDKATLEGMAVAELIGEDNARKLLVPSQDSRWQAESIVLKVADGPELHLEPTLTEVSDGQGNLAIQVLFRDVTEEHGWRAGLKAYTAHMVRAQEEERQRIARELHDTTIQSLVLLCRRLDSLQSASQSLPSSLSNSLKEVRETAEEVVKGLRDFTRALRPPVLDDLGIVTSIRRLLADLTARSQIKDELKVVGNYRRLSPDIELGLFRISQEALGNVERHARATRVAVTVTFTREEVRLEVVDNGIGFSPAPVSGNLTTSGQLGIWSMQERAELLGGKLEIHSRPESGTRVNVSLPVKDAVPEISASRPD